jgi:hypothetical protein
VWWVSLVKRIFQEELGPAYKALGQRSSFFPNIQIFRLMV